MVYGAVYKVTEIGSGYSSKRDSTVTCNLGDIKGLLGKFRAWLQHLL